MQKSGFNYEHDAITKFLAARSVSKTPITEIVIEFEPKNPAQTPIALPIPEKPIGMPETKAAIDPTKDKELVHTTEEFMKADLDEKTIISSLQKELKKNSAVMSSHLLFRILSKQSSRASSCEVSSQKRFDMISGKLATKNWLIGLTKNLCVIIIDKHNQLHITYSVGSNLTVYIIMCTLFEQSTKEKHVLYDFYETDIFEFDGLI